MLAKGKESSDGLRLKEKYGDLEYMAKHPVSYVQHVKVNTCTVRDNESYFDSSCNM